MTCYVYVWLNILVWDTSIQTLFERLCFIWLVIIIIVNACCALIYVYIYMHMHISYANGPIWHVGCLIILTHLMTKESMQCKLQGIFVTSSTEASRKLGASFSESYVVLVCFDCLSLCYLLVPEMIHEDSMSTWSGFSFGDPVSVLFVAIRRVALWGELWSDLAQWRLEGSPFWWQELILLTSMFCVAACRYIYIDRDIPSNMYVASIYDNILSWSNN